MLITFQIKKKLWAHYFDFDFDFDFDVHAAVQFYPWYKFCLALFLGLVMYDKQNIYTPRKEKEKKLVALSGSLEVSVSPKAYDIKWQGKCSSNNKRIGHSLFIHNNYFSFSFLQNNGQNSAFWSAKKTTENVRFRTRDRLPVWDARIIHLQNLSKLTQKQIVSWSVHPKLKPFHFQIKTYYLSAI